MRRMPRLALAFALAPAAITGLALAGCNIKPEAAQPCTTLTDLGACVPDPSILAQRTACVGISSYCDTRGVSAPVLSCLGGPAPTPPPPTTPPSMQQPTVVGFVHALESGPDTSGLTVQVIDPAQLANGGNPAFVQTVGSTTAVLDGTVACSAKQSCATGQQCISGRCWTSKNGIEPLQRACDVDPRLGCVFALSDGCNHTCNDGLYGRRDDDKYCRDDGKGGTCRQRLRWEASYSINNVRTDRDLVMRVSGPGGTANPTWVPALRWKVLFATTARDCSGNGDSDCVDRSVPSHLVYHLDVDAAARADWVRLAQLSGLAGGVPSGDGALYGEVHDCEGVRLSGVAVAVKPAAARVSYFTPDPAALTPDVTRAVTGTDPLGRFSAWGVRPGRVTVDAAGIALMPVQVDGGTVLRGQVTSFGRDDVFVYNGTLSIVTINGGIR
jgi:hypothetical protein